MCMKKSSSPLSSRVVSIVMACGMIVSPSLCSAAIDETNPSELNPGDYASGKKRASDAAKRVIPRLKTEMHKTGVAAGNPVFIRVFKHEDLQAVEGFYTVGKWSLNPQSRFHLSFNLGYPNKYDKAHKRTGHSLMVHGNSVSAGCLAMTDYNIEEIYTLCDQALKYGQNEWYGFWQNLKTGYDLFEKSKLPPTVSVKGKRYVFK